MERALARVARLEDEGQEAALKAQLVQVGRRGRDARGGLAGG
jgi:hypothetical protein